MIWSGFVSERLLGGIVAPFDSSWDGKHHPWSSPAAAFLPNRPDPRYRRDGFQAFYILFESSSGYSLFEVVQHETIGNLTEEVS